MFRPIMARRVDPVRDTDRPEQEITYRIRRAMIAGRGLTGAFIGTPVRMNASMLDVYRWGNQ